MLNTQKLIGMSFENGCLYKIYLLYLISTNRGQPIGNIF